MSGITPGCPRMGMGVFTGIFRSAALLISNIYLPMAEMPVNIPRTMSAIMQIVATPSLLSMNMGKA